MFTVVLVKLSVLSFCVDMSDSKVSPLNCLLKYWKEAGFGQSMHKKKLIEYCTHWWPEYKLPNEVQWPPEGTLNHEIIAELMRFCQREGKWDEVPYVDLFFYLERKHDWRESCGLMLVQGSSNNKCVGCTTEKKCMTCLAVENSSGNDSKTDLLCFDVAPSEEGVPIRPSAPVLPVDSDDESSDERGAIAGVKGITVTPISHRTRNREKEKEAQRGGGLSNVIAPLRQAVGVGGEPVYVKVPFSPGDLVIWKQSAGPYRENPDKVAKVIKMIIKTQNPDWDDLQVILDTLMDSTEKYVVIQVARDKVREDIRNGKVEANVDKNFPKEDPQ